MTKLKPVANENLSLENSVSAIAVRWLHLINDDIYNIDENHLRRIHSTELYEMMSG